tara:strand:+ start:179 stop:1459 length:1281 start_codon:yes stop_codon:yes gene_type:complete
MEFESLNIEIPEDLVILANSTKPEDIPLDEWILEWTKFGLEVSQMASSRKEALDIQANIVASAESKFSTIIGKIGTGEGQLLEGVGIQISNYEDRLDDLERLTDLKEKEVGFGRLFQDIKDFVNPNNTDSIIYQYNTMIGNVDDENGLIRTAIRKELAKEGGITKSLGEISLKLGLDEKEKEVTRKSTLKGDEIEDTLLLNLENLFPGNDLTFNKLTNTTGAIKMSKKGDVILRFGTDHALHGCPIIYEMKSDDTFYLEGSNPDTSATDYLALAMKNRECKVGIFVMDKATAFENKGWKRSLTVAGDKIFVVWDPDDPSTDWLLTVATYIAIGRNKPPENVIDPKERDAISKVTTELEAEATRYSKMRTQIDNIQSNADKLSEHIRIGADGIQRCIKHAKTTLKILEMDSTELTDIDFDDVNLDSN